MFIVDALRTPIGKFHGQLSTLAPPDLTKPLFQEFLKRNLFLGTKTNLVIMGEVLTTGVGMNPARLASVKGGISQKTPAYTINHACASSLTAIINGYQAIQMGEADLVIAGGLENMSQAPNLQTDGLYCPLTESSMGLTAENLAQKFNITREYQDEYSYQSHQKALTAIQKHLFDVEMISCNQLDLDEGPRRDTSIEKLNTLQPVFQKNGTVTAGNSSQLSDGASLVLLASSSAIKRYHLKPLARIVGHATIGLNPKLMGLGPVEAIKLLLKKTHLNLNDIDLFEINEAFAAQILAVIQSLKLDPQKVNPYGGGIALGHPLGATGARIVTTLVHALKQQNQKYGVASLCVGGGQGVALLIESL
jgi:acetyl-CoA acetyltransferase family protein